MAREELPDYLQPKEPEWKIRERQQREAEAMFNLTQAVEEVETSRLLDKAAAERYLDAGKAIGYLLEYIRRRNL